MVGLDGQLSPFKFDNMFRKCKTQAVFAYLDAGGLDPPEVLANAAQRCVQNAQIPVDYANFDGIGILYDLNCHLTISWGQVYGVR
jgi:hypothetical protein